MILTKLKITSKINLVIIFLVGSLLLCSNYQLAGLSWFSCGLLAIWWLLLTVTRLSARTWLLLIAIVSSSWWILEGDLFWHVSSLNATVAIIDVIVSSILGGLIVIILQLHGQRDAVIMNVTKPSGAIIGTDSHTQQAVTLSHTDANHHTLVVGTTGTGKTTTICNIVETAIIDDLPLFYLDGKGDLALAKKIQQFADRKQKPFYLFSMLGEHSCKYNPLYSGGITAKKDRIIELRTWSESYYQKIAENYLQVVFAVMAELGLSSDLATLAHYLSLDELFIIARNNKQQHLLDQLAKIEAYKKEAQGLIVEIDNLVNSEIGHLFKCDGEPAINLEQIYTENAIVYFCLSPLAFPSYSETVGKLIINDLKILFANNITKGRTQPTYTIFDEFSVFAGDQVVNLINQGRSAGACAVLATQSLADIGVKGGRYLLGQIVNNCNNYIIQRQNNPEDAEFIANIIGKQTTLMTSVATNQVGVNTTTATLVDTPIITADAIKQLQHATAIVLNKRTNIVNNINTRKGAIV